MSGLLITRVGFRTTNHRQQVQFAHHAMNSFAIYVLFLVSLNPKLNAPNAIGFHHVGTQHHFSPAVTFQQHVYTHLFVSFFCKSYLASFVPAIFLFEFFLLKAEKPMISLLLDSYNEYSARDCAARPLKLSIHSGGIEHACRRR